jgi:hypothetical protein
MSWLTERLLASPERVLRRLCSYKTPHTFLLTAALLHNDSNVLVTSCLIQQLLENHCLHYSCTFPNHLTQFSVITSSRTPIPSDTATASAPYDTEPFRNTGNFNKYLPFQCCCRVYTFWPGDAVVRFLSQPVWPTAVHFHISLTHFRAGCRTSWLLFPHLDLWIL